MRNHVLNRNIPALAILVATALAGCGQYPSGIAANERTVQCYLDVPAGLSQEELSKAVDAVINDPPSGAICTGIVPRDAYVEAMETEQREDGAARVHFRFRLDSEPNPQVP